VKYSNFLQYLCYCLINFEEISNSKAYRLLKLVSNQKFENFKIQVDRRHPTRKLRKILITFYLSAQNSEKSAYNRLPAKPLKYSNFYDIFADVWPIFMKFCMITHIRYPEHNSCSKSQISKNSREWTLPFKKIVKCDISAIVSLILMKFDATMRISHCNFNSRSVHS